MLTFPMLCYFTHMEAKNVYFVADKHKPRGSPHTTLLFLSRAHPALFILKLPLSVTLKCRDLHLKGYASTSGCQTLWKECVFTVHIVEVAEFAQSDPNLLWVVRPCLWLVLSVMRGSGVCFLFMATCVLLLFLRKNTQPLSK